MDLKFYWHDDPEKAQRPLRWVVFGGAIDIEGTGVLGTHKGGGTDGSWLVCTIRGAPKADLLAMADALVTLVELRVYGSDA